MKVVFVHLDLGIGGAEMLVVNSAVSAQEAGHEVRVYTSHHDARRCFRETTGKGALAGTVRVRGDWLPRHLFGKFTALCAIMRMMWLALCILLTERCVDVIFCDGVSAPVPLLRVVAPVLFYCHFPDKLLCVSRDSLWKRIYRWPLDMAEELTTGCATCVAVNSNFTAGIFREAFPRIGKNYSLSGAGGEFTTGTRHGRNGGRGTNRAVSGRGSGKLRVLYPPTNVDSYPERGPGDALPEGRMGPIVSLNRFERKKNLPLAIMAVGWAVNEMGAEQAFSDRGLRLIIAGGYDERVVENVEHLEELKQLTRELGLERVVEFRTNIGDEERSSLLRKASCVLYTPSMEHFGIVPVEAMCSGAPVIAVNSGGPLETIVDGGTGFLCPPTAETFGSAIVEIASAPALSLSMGKEGRQRVQERFSMESFAQSFDASLVEVAETGRRASHRLFVRAGFAVLAALPVAWMKLGGAKGFDA